MLNIKRKKLPLGESECKRRPGEKVQSPGNGSPLNIVFFFFFVVIFCNIYIYKFLGLSWSDTLQSLLCLDYNTALCCKCLDAATSVEQKHVFVLKQEPSLIPFKNNRMIYTTSCHTGKQVSRPDGGSFCEIKTAAASLSARCLLVSRCY